MFKDNNGTPLYPHICTSCNSLLLLYGTSDNSYCNKCASSTAQPIDFEIPESFINDLMSKRNGHSEILEENISSLVLKSFGKNIKWKITIKSKE